MGSLYILNAHGTTAPFAPVEVATTTSAKTLLQLAVPSTTSARVFAWGVSFDGVASTDPAGQVELFACTASPLATVTTFTPDKWEAATAPASLCVGGANLTGYNASAEGTLTAYRPLDVQQVHPQSGYSVWFLDGRHASVDPSSQVRIRTTFSVTVNCLPWIIWEEPA
jgi:hypothetical protein